MVILKFHIQEWVQISLRSCFVTMIALHSFISFYAISIYFFISFSVNHCINALFLFCKSHCIKMLRTLKNVGPILM